MRSKDLEDYLAERMMRSSSALDQIARALREARMLPAGGRGVGAPHLDAKHVANFVIAAAVSRNLSEVSHIVKFYGALSYRIKDYQEPIMGDLGSVGEIITFKAALVALLSGKGDDGKVGPISFRRSAPYHGLIGVTSAKCDFGEFVPRSRLSGVAGTGEEDDGSGLSEAEEQLAVEEITFGAKLMDGVASLINEGAS